MARQSWIAKQDKEVKFSTRRVNRCKLCGRSRGYMRQFGLCRICFRENALEGNIPGVRKASW
ncbi:MAG: type Z 30S ribosomal protein S14 [Armatimonadota bacterium]